MNERRRHRPDLSKGTVPQENSGRDFSGRDFSVSRDPRARVDERPAKSGVAKSGAAKSGAAAKPGSFKPDSFKSGTAKPRQSKLDYDKPRRFQDAAKGDTAKGDTAKSDFGRNNLSKAHPDKPRSAPSGYDRPRREGVDAEPPRSNRPPKLRHVVIDDETEIETRDSLRGEPRVPHNKADEKLIYGFHAVLARLRHDPAGVLDIYVDVNRRDARSRDLIHHARDAGVNLSQVEIDRIERLVGKGATHQGVVARVRPVVLAQSLDDILDAIDGPPLLLLLDGVTDPHNLGAILRSAGAFGVHAVVAPKDNAVGINATVEKVASGAADSVPYLMVTNLARTIDELKERNVWVIAADMDGDTDIGGIDAKTGIAWVLGAEGGGIRRLVKQGCDQVARIPIGGVVESLNVSVSAALCLYETARQRRVK